MKIRMTRGSYTTTAADGSPKQHLEGEAFEASESEASFLFALGVAASAPDAEEPPAPADPPPAKAASPAKASKS